MVFTEDVIDIDESIYISFVMKDALIDRDVCVPEEIQILGDKRNNSGIDYFWVKRAQIIGMCIDSAFVRYYLHQQMM